MLPYSWPETVALEARLRSDAQNPCDLSLVLAGNSGDNAFPWREGLLFTFGGHFNQASLIRVHEQPDKDYAAADCGARIEPGRWHQVRFEREGNVARAWVDGKMVQESALTAEQQLPNRRLAVYTFN